MIKQQIKEAEWALEDLLRIKKNGTYNEYVTQSNINQWITGQRLELNRLREKYEKSILGEFNTIVTISRKNKSILIPIYKFNIFCEDINQAFEAFNEADKWIEKNINIEDRNNLVVDVNPIERGLKWV